ncbi:MAG TPA: hypothetical protein VN867_08540, partial [Candidatus Binataceae bacterium]|nr:hypothetical protein [Candidatus Binataceae bacterium]
GLAAAGVLSPALAALVHVTSELTFILNSVRLLPSAKRRAKTAAAPALDHHQATSPIASGHRDFYF